MNHRVLKIILGSFFALLLFAAPRLQEPDQFVDPRDSNQYEVVSLGGLYWFKENLRYRMEAGSDTLIELGQCGVFYNFEAATKACPEGWRLPTEKEIKPLLKEERKGRINVAEVLSIELCGRIDYEKHSKPGLQNTFWLNERLEEGHVMHWHTFADENELHSHDVINARRKFPVRCVCETLPAESN